MISIKDQLHKKCIAIVDDKIKVQEKAFSDIQNALLSETKSSAGDKHETGRAMLQIEREKIGRQLSELARIQTVLQKIETTTVSPVISLGSVVYTSQHQYFIAASLGEMTLENDSFYCISPQTPIGKILLSKRKGDLVNFNGTSIEILEVV